MPSGTASELSSFVLWIRGGVFVALVTLLGLAAGPVQAQVDGETFVVEVSGSFTGDAPDTNPGDGVCEISTGDCTFIAAVQEANADADTDRIEFASTFNPTASQDHNFLFPDNTITLTNPVVIDGRTAPQYQQGVRLGVTLYSQETDADAPGIVIESGAAGTEIYGLAVVDYPGDGFVVRADDVAIVDCYASVIDDGISTQPNGGAGIRVESGTNVQIGEYGLTGAPNVFSGNDGDGIELAGGTAYVGGNLVGLRPDGTTADPNGGVGIRVLGGTDHQIGTRFVSQFLGTLYSGNVVSAHTNETGIVVADDGHALYGNVVGLTADQSATRANRRGIALQADDVTVGPPSRGTGSNIVAGNDGNGIIVGYNSVAANNTVIQNNYVGVARTTGTLAGNNVGIAVFSGNNTLVDDNVVGANAGGISVGQSATRTALEGNLVGTNDAREDLGNRKDGITVESDPTQDFEATDIGPGNIVAFTGGDGITLRGRFNDVTDTYVGTDASGANLGNDGAGIVVDGNNQAQIGGSATPNVIGFNTGPGIHVRDAQQVVVEGNRVGTNDDGADLGNGGAGILVEATTGSTASDNRIGYGYGGSILSSAQPPIGNQVENNAGAGIQVTGPGTALGNSIRANTTRGNAGLGIELGGDGTNGVDAGDGDTGVNRRINSPEIDPSSTYDPDANTLTITYRVRCDVANCDYGTDGLRVDFYTSTESDEGAQYVGTDTYPSSAAQGTVTTSFTPAASGVRQTDFLLGVTTDAQGNSSEFPSSAGRLPVELAGFDAAADGERVTLTWRTLSETNNARFAVEHRGPEADDFRVIGSRPGQGTTSETTSYRFVTDALVAGAHTFRLRQVDMDGTETLSETVTARIALDGPAVLRAPAPNPARGTVSITFGVDTSAPVQIAVYDLLGRRLHTLYDGTPTPGRETTIQRSVDRLPPGRYFLRLEGPGRALVRGMTVIR